MFEMFMAQGALGVLGAFQGAQQAESDAARQKMQIEWGNHVQKLQAASQNRKIHRANAAQWMQNQEITRASYEQEAEEHVYIRHRIENEIGNYSRQWDTQADQLDAALQGRNMQGGTARAIFNSARASRELVMGDLSITAGNASRDARRRRDQNLAQRNFGYNDYVKYVSTDSSHIDPKAAGKNALMGGLLKAGISTLGAARQDSFKNEMMSFKQSQLDVMKANLPADYVLPERSGGDFLGGFGNLLGINWLFE
jgi:hypothetical protein